MISFMSPVPDECGLGRMLTANSYEKNMPVETGECIRNSAICGLHVGARNRNELRNGLEFLLLGHAPRAGNRPGCRDDLCGVVFCKCFGEVCRYRFLGVEELSRIKAGEIHDHCALHCR